MGKIYLSSYYTKDYGVPEGVTYINVARKDMQGINEKIIDLAPSKELFSWYFNHKDEPDWFDYYEEQYKKQVIMNKDSRKILINIKKRLDEGEDICFLCFCRKSIKCHRGLLGKFYKNYGIEIIDTDL